MTPATDEAAVFRFSTDGLPPHQRASAVRAMHERCTLAAKPEPMEALSDQEVRVDIEQWALPGLGLMSGALSGLRQHIRPQCSAPTGANDVFLALNIAGAAVVNRRGDQVLVRNGDAFSTTRGANGFTVVRPGRARFIGLRLPVRALSPLVPELDGSEVRVIPRSTAALKLLRSYVNLITHESALTTAELQRVSVSHIYDLAAVTLGTTADRAELARNRGIRAARLEGIKADIIARVGDGKLSAGAVAARHALALRSLQKLFEAAGTTFSEFLLDQRLARAYRALTNRLHARRSISEIAYDSGFNDLSYFNRAFRRRYGATPSDVRHGP